MKGHLCTIGFSCRYRRILEYLAIRCLLCASLGLISRKTNLLYFVISTLLSSYSKMALLPRRPVPQRRRRLFFNNPDGDFHVQDPPHYYSRELEDLPLQRVEHGQGDGGHSNRGRYAHNPGLFFQVMRQMALDFNLVEYHIRSKVIKAEEFRLQEQLLEDVIKTTVMMMTSTVLWLGWFVMLPVKHFTPLAPIYTIFALSQCFLLRMLYIYKKDNVVQKRMRVVRKRLATERAQLTRAIENMFES